MGEASRIRFSCDSCGKSYRVPADQAGRKAKCKACGAGMRVPAAQTQRDDDAPLRLVDDDSPAPLSRELPPRPKQAAGKQDVPVQASEGTLGLDGTPEDKGPDWSALLGDKGDGAKYDLTTEAGSSSEGFPLNAVNTPQSFGHGQGMGIKSMMNALAASFQPTSGRPSLVQRFSFGGFFILFASVVCMIASQVSISSYNKLVVDSVIHTGADPLGSPISAAQEFPAMVVGGLGLIVSLLLIGWRIYSPRRESENPLIVVLVCALLLATVVISFMTLVGAGQSATIIAGLGSLAVLLASAVLGGWVIYRLNQDLSGLAMSQWLLPAVIIPVGAIIAGLVEILILSEGEANLSKLPWGTIILGLIIIAIVVFFMGSVVAFYLVVGSPFLLLSLDHVQIRTGMVIMLVVLAICLYCYLSVFKNNWRLLAKPVLWQFTMLFFGTAVMGSLVGASFRAQVVAENNILADEQAEALKAYEQTGERIEASSAFKRAIKRQLMIETGVNPESSQQLRRHRVTVKNGRFGLIFAFGHGYSPDEWDGKLPPMSIEELKLAGQPVGDRGDWITSSNSGGDQDHSDSNRSGSRPVEQIGPILAPEDLPTALEELDATGETWFEFAPPKYADSLLNGDSINLGGLMIPEVDGMTIRVLKRGRDIKLVTFEDSTSKVSGTKPSMMIQLSFIEPETPERWVIEFDRQFSNLLRASQMSRSDRYEDQYRKEFGTVGGVRMMRYEAFPKESSRGNGGVSYIGYIPEAEGRLLHIGYNTLRSDPESARRFEAIVRSIVVQPESWSDGPGETVETGLKDQGAELGVNSPKVGPIMLGTDRRPSQISFVEVGHSDFVIEPATLIPQVGIEDPERAFRHSPNNMYFKCVPATDRDPQLTVPRVRLTGSSEISDIENYAVSAYGGDVSYVKLWDDQTFVRIDHGIASIESSRPRSENVLYKVTYAGFLGDFYYCVDLLMEPEDDGRLALDEAFLSGQLLTMPQIESHRFRTTDFAKTLIDTRFDFPTAGGSSFRAMVDENPWELYVYGFGTGEEKITRPSTRPTNTAPLVSDVEPRMTGEELRNYRTWRALGSEDQLAGPVAVAEYEINAPSELRMSDSNARGARWVPPASGTRVGMTLELENLRPEHHNLTNPILIDERGNRSFLLGTREIPSRANVEVTYQEINDVRIWRILPGYNRDDRVASCYYVIQGETQQLVLTVRFQPSKPEQLRVFDAAAATIKPVEAAEAAE